MSNANVLSTQSIAAIMLASLSSETTPQLKTPYDAIALATHAAMLAVGFRLDGLGEDHKIEARQAEQGEAQPLPTEWNATSGNYAFRYKHAQSSMEYLVKINRMGSKAVIMGMGLGDDKTTSFDVRVEDYISPSSLPATPLAAENTDEARRKLVGVFISDGRLSDLGALMRLNVIQKLLPSLHKEGYEETRNQTGAAATSAQREGRAPPGRTDRDPLRNDPTPARPHPLADPLVQPPRRPIPGEFNPPGFEDPYDLNRPMRPMGGSVGPSYGQRDLYPQGLGPNDPFGSMGPGAGGIRGGGGGMHPTFDDPLFQGQGGSGGYGYDPQAPPGSRYDPVGPGGRPARGSGGGFSGGMGGQPHNPFGGFGGSDFI